MKIKSFDIVKEYPENETLLNILKDIKGEDYKDYFGASINNEIYGLFCRVDSDCEITFLDIKTREGMMIYQSTLRYIMSYALQELFPGNRVVYNYSISRAIFCQPVGPKRVSYEMVSLIDKKMKEIIDADLPIEFISIDIEEAKKIYQKQGYTSKVELLSEVSKKNKIEIYKTNDYYNYMDNWLCPSTGFTKNFILNLYTPGIIMQYPRSEFGGIIPQFQDETVLSKYLREQNKWGQITGASYVNDFNKIVRNGGINELINLCETRHNNMLAELGEEIERDIENIKLIAVSGPSSSGKTTFTNRLRIELMSRGIKPLMISLDNYYRADGKYPLDIDGNPDYEHIEALDLELFNKQMLALIDGEEVSLPEFDFKTRKVSFMPPVRIGKNQPILIEGIHALNDRLSMAIPKGNKYRIYIAPQTQLHIDSQNPISLTDIRLIRRMVRDYRDRGSDPKNTIQMWDSVRRGEFKWIYPFQENADYVFNSELTYELGALKNTLVEILKHVKKSDLEYSTAQRLYRIVKYIEPISEKWIPCNSIIREFIGGSIFYEK